MLYLFFVFQKILFFIINSHKLLSQNTIQFIPICSKILYKRRNMLYKNEKYHLSKLFLPFRKIRQVLQKNHWSEIVTPMNIIEPIKTPKGKDAWHEGTVSKILKNEKYKGDVLQGKTFTTDPITHKRVANMGEEDKYYISEHHEAIIEPEIFDRVQQVMKDRRGARACGRRLGNVGRKFNFSSRLRCGFCGGCYGRRSIYGCL